MNFKRIVYLILLLFICSLTACGVSEESSYRGLTTREKIKDFQYLYNTIKENYPFLHSNNRLNEVNWLTKEREFIDSIKSTKSDEEFLHVLNNILKELNNDYTKMIINDEINYYINYYSNNSTVIDIINNPKVQEKYINYIETTNNDFIEDTTDSSVDNIVTKDLVNGDIAYISINKMLDIEYMDKDIHTLDNYFEKIKDYNALVIDIRETSGKSEDYWKYYLLSRLVRDTLTSTTYSFLRNDTMLNKILNENKSNSLKIQMVNNLIKNSVPNLPNEISDEFIYYNVYDTTVSPRNSVSFQGRIYLLVNKNTSEAAEGLAIFSKQSGFATLIGENLLGKSTMGDPAIDMLPNSGYVFSFAKEFPTTSDGTSIIDYQIPPNYEVADTTKSTDLTSDSCIAKVLELEGLNAESTLSINPKEFDFNTTLDSIIEFNEYYNEIYSFIGDLLNKYNGEITLFENKEEIEYKFRKQYDNNNIFSFNYKIPTKISIQSNYMNISHEYRDKFSNICLTVSKISVVCLENENRIILKLLGENHGIVLEFYDNILAKEFSDLLNRNIERDNPIE